MSTQAPARSGLLTSRVTGWRDALRARMAAYMRRRHGAEHLPLTVAARRTYILPTRGGLAFSLLLLVMLLAGLNYANSIALMLTFLLGGFTLIAMHLAHRNLLGVVARGVTTVNAFSGEHGLVRLTLEATGKAQRFFIECEVDGARGVASLPETGSARLEVAVPLNRRGSHHLPRLKLSTSFPFGLFRAWTYLHLDLRLLAWPVPRGRHEPPPEAATGGAATALHRAGDEEWAGLREFRHGDSPRQVAWAAFARGRGLLVKTYESPAAHHRVFDFAPLPGGVEQRLEQLSTWIVAAHARGERFGLRLGSLDIAPDSGSQHRERCLDALALFGEATSR